MARMSNSLKTTESNIYHLSTEIEDRLTHIERSARLSKRQALAEAKTHGAEGLTDNQLDYMVQLGLIVPKIINGDRNTHLYGRDQVRDAILVHYLHVHEKLSYTKIGTTLSSLRNSGAKPEDGPSNEVGVPQQEQRALLTLRSRIIGVLLNWLLCNGAKPGTVIHIRQTRFPHQKLPKELVKVSHDWRNLTQADSTVGDFRRQDLVGNVVRDGEVLFSGFPQKSFVDFKYTTWLHLSVEFGEPLICYSVTIGFPDDVTPSEVHFPQDSHDKEILALLLKTAALRIEGSLAVTSRKAPNHPDHSTLLRSLAEVVPSLSPTWEYCAILTAHSRQPEHLVLAAMSSDFPVDMRSDTVVQFGQPLTGWAFANDSTILVQPTTGPNDPRLAYQEIERATAAVALPTHARGQCNGVLYVGTRFKLPADNQAFHEVELRILQILADIAGEIIERNRTRIDAETAALVALTRPSLSIRHWTELKVDLKAAFTELMNGTLQPRASENLHITAVRVETATKVREKHPGVANWIEQHVVNSVREHFFQHELGDPRVYRRDSTYLNEFACLVSRLVITDENDRRLRNVLRDTLSSVTLTFSFRERVLVTSHVWSLPFRLKGLRERLTQLGDGPAAIEQLVAEIVREVEEALITLPYIEAAHNFEQQGAYVPALEQYLTALSHAPKNRYLLRHAAKTYAAVGDYRNSAKMWVRLIDLDKHPRHYARYAFALGAMGKIDEASVQYNQACELDQDNAGILMEWGDLLLACGKNKEAIQRYEEALRQTTGGRLTLWRRLSEASLAGDDLVAAEDYARLVLLQLPDDPDARRLMLKILRKKECARNSDHAVELDK